MPYKTESYESALADETSEEFLTDDDLNILLDEYARDLHSDLSLVERIRFLRDQARSRAKRKLDCKEEDGLFLRKEAIEQGKESA